MTHPGHNLAIPIANEQAMVMHEGTDFLYYIVTPLNNVPYFFKGTPHIPAFILADEKTLDDIDMVLGIPFLHLQEWKGG